MKYSDALTVFREASDRSVADLAARSGVSRPTLYRLFAGAVPRVDDLEELAVASGWELELDLTSLSDPLAGVAARLELGDDTVEAWAEEAARWRERLQRFSAARASDPRDLAVIDDGGKATAPGSRPGAVHLRGEHRIVDRLVSAGRASNGRWALSGWAALDALGVDVDAPTIMWVDDARQITQLLQGSFRPGRPKASDLIVVEAHPSVFAGAEAIDDVELVAPLQASLDAVGLGGAARDHVLSMIGGASIGSASIGSTS